MAKKKRQKNSRVKKAVRKKSSKKRIAFRTVHLLSILSTFVISLFFLSTTVTGNVVSSGAGRSTLFLIGAIFFIASLIELGYFLKLRKSH
jgi:hypothetical protein